MLRAYIMARPGSGPRRPRRTNGNGPRNGYGGGDRDRDYDRPPPPPRYDGPRHDSDSWRPSDGRRGDDRARPYDDYRPPSDSYRPRPPQGDFTFRFDKPAGVGESGTGSRPHDRQGFRRDRGGRGRGRGRWQPPPHPSERALVSGATKNLPEERLNAGDGVAKYRDIDELSDDDELEMEISSPNDSETDEPSRKRTRTSAVTSESADAAPKWSNPDPYTALPCPDAGDRKKKDMVKLIRKARVEESAAKPAATTKAENFISFDSSEDDEEEEEEDEEEDEDDVQIVPPPPPPPPVNGRASQTGAQLPPPPRDLPPPPPPPTGPAAERRDTSGPLGSRKRTADDEIKPPDYGELKKLTMKPSKGHVLPNWKEKDDEEPCPWAAIDHSATSNMAFRLHKEVMDFYEYVRPRKFEQRIRDNLVENLRRAMKRDGRNFASAQVHPFGSFMSGLYLPTADMDLVVTSASFMRGGPPTYLSARSWLYKFSKFLVAQRVADQPTIQVIAHARVPLVKFVDKLTGLKVDVSFENLGGVDAINKFLQWKEQYPAMPILVTVIKHFLMMRGLNEPVTGGIGGFSVICLVVSMLQLMPQVQSRSLIPEHHLGEMLLEFFDLYGHNFDYVTTAISLTRPVGYMRKSEVTGFAYKNQNRLSIIDPNNPSNDISGGSSNIAAVVSRFSEAYDRLRDRMKDVAEARDHGGILDIILAGDYSSFRLQRNYLKHVHEKTIGPCD
ncbi:topoisomerase family TRF4 [Paramyrothecium foliicola]|nr:topoisomerase family TRF4 [Paramyrothecium foliicola]